MGIYLNPGNEMLRQDRNAEIFIDKSLVIAELNKHVNSREKFFCVSRPRRFGKSLLVSTLQCYFEGRKELFSGLAMERLETEWKKYPVLYFDFNGQNYVDENKKILIEKRKINRE